MREICGTKMPGDEVLKSATSTQDKLPEKSLPTSKKK
jgi:hypothetical protein